MNLPEKLVQDTHNTEEGLQRRLAEYRMANNDDETVTNVFEEEYEIEIIKYTPDVIEDDKSYLHKTIVDAIKIKNMNDPRNYGLTPEEKDLIRRVENEERIRKQIEWVIFKFSILKKKNYFKSFFKRLKDLRK